MLKRLLTALLALLLLFTSVALTACNDDDFTVPSHREDDETPDDGGEEDNGPEDTSKDEEGERTPADPTDPTSPGSLWYYEDFEDVNLINENNTAVATALGWGYAPKSEGGNGGTATYSIKDHNGSRMLYIKNAINGANDSYLTILEDEQFRYLHQRNYTYQYDIIYTEALADAEQINKRYINLVSQYDSKFYHSFHLRNSGYADFQCYDTNANNNWYTFDSGSADKGSSSILTRLFGEVYDSTKQSLSNHSISVRYVTNWETGFKVFLRTNGDGLKPGEWILVGEYKSTPVESGYLNPDYGKAALALKVGGGQNGYVDNIKVWCGDENDEPAADATPWLHADTACHQMITLNGTVFCYLCGDTRYDIEQQEQEQD